MAHDSSAIGRLALLAALAFGSVAGPALAQETPEQREACMHDTKRLCENEMPDVGRAVECLKANKARLNHRCRKALDAPQPAAASPPATPAKAPVAPAPLTTPAAPAKPASPAPTAAPPAPQAASDQPARPTPPAPKRKAPRRSPHLAFAPHWRYTLRRPRVPLVRHHTMTPAERVLATARRCRAAGTTYNPYSGTCFYNNNGFGGFFQ